MDATRTTRGRNVRTAILTSIVARLSGVLLQVVSLPIAAAALGNEGFALYAMMMAVLSWLSLSMVGLGPAITVSMSLNSVGNSDKFRQIFSTGVLCMAAISVVVSLLGLILVFLTGVPDTIFALYQNRSSEITLCLTVVLVIFFLSINLASIEAAQLALQSQGMYNILISIGTLLASICVIIVAQNGPSPSSILIAAQTPLIGARIINATIFLSSAPHLMPSVRLMRASIAKSLLLQGSQFAMAGPFNNFLTHVFPVLVIGAIAPPSRAAAFAATMNALIVLSSVFGLASRPLLGAVPEAHARQDAFWINSTYVRTLVFSAGYGLFCFVVLSILGTSIFKVWYQDSIHPSELQLALAGFYIIWMGVEIVNYTFLSSIGLLKHLSQTLLLKSGVFAGLLLILSPDLTDYQPFALLVVTNIALSATPLTMMAYRRIRSLAG